MRGDTCGGAANAGSCLSGCTLTTLATDDEVTLPVICLLGGDLNDDDVIKIGGAMLLTANFDEAVPLADARADINNDTIITVQDLAILADNYEISGCRPW